MSNYKTPEEYISYYKNMLIYPKKYPDNFENLYTFIKNILLTDTTSLIKFKYGLHFNRSMGDYHFKNTHNNWPLFTIDQYEKFVKLYLELIGFTKYVKDYVLICSYSLYSVPHHLNDFTHDKMKYINFSFRVLFDKPDFSNIKDIDLEEDYFNERLFFIQKEGQFHDYYWLRLREFMDEFAYQLFWAIEKKEIIINDNLIIEDLVKLKNTTLMSLKEFYSKKNAALFSGYSDKEDLSADQYYTENDILSGKYSHDRKLPFFDFFFNGRVPWINFVLGLEKSLFNDPNIINSQVFVDYIGNCKYLIESKG